MPFLATCPSCGYAKRQARLDYPRSCPRCATPWLASIRVDPPADPEAAPIRQALNLLENFIGTACLFTPEEAFTAGILLKQSADAVEGEERRLRLCIVGFLRARARLGSGPPPA